MIDDDIHAADRHSTERGGPDGGGGDMLAATRPSKPPRARVSDAPLSADPTPGPSDSDDGGAGNEGAGDKLARKKDYLAGFLAQPSAEVAAGGPGGALYEAVIDALKSIYDPEIPVNIYELGLIYGVDVSDEGDVAITMTLTTPHCPVAETMPAEIELRAASLPGVRDARVEVTWDPPWDPSKMSDEARLELGML